MPHDVRHETFSISRQLPATRSAVYAAFADDAVRRRWFRLPGPGATYEHEFRVGGGEIARSAFAIADRPPERLENRSRYIQLTPDRRIVFAYDAMVDDVVRWTSLVTVLLVDDAGGTRLDWTEQVAFLVPTGDGSADLPHLRGGTSLRLNGLPKALGIGAPAGI